MENRAADKAREEAMSLIRSALRKDMTELFKRSDERQKLKAEQQAQQEKEKRERQAQKEKEKREQQAMREKEEKERQARQKEERLHERLNDVTKMDSRALEEKIRTFNELYPGANIESSDNAIRIYSLLALRLMDAMTEAIMGNDRDEARRLADLVCEKYTAIFTGMKDFTTLRAAAITKIFSYTYMNDMFRIPNSSIDEAQALLNRINAWSSTANSPMLTARWKKIFDAGLARRYMERWDGMDDGFVAYIKKLLG